MLVISVLSFFLYGVSAYTITTDECGMTKGCWLEPQGCESNGTANSCQYAFTWRPTESDLVIEMGTTNTEMGFMGPLKYGAYISVAFSNDDKMGHDAVIECVDNAAGVVKAFMSYNDGTHNYRLNQATAQMISKTQGSVENGFLACTTRRKWAPPDSVTGQDHWMSFDLASRSWVLQLAKGNSDSLTFAMKMHWLSDGELFPWIAKHKTDLQGSPFMVTRAKHYDVPRSMQYSLVAAHGILTVVGWWWFASIGFFVSRYFKPMWVKKKLLGTQVWYQLHRDILIASLVVSSIGFGLVYVQAGDWKSCTFQCDDKDYALAAHTIMGVICTVLAISQPFFAWARPYMRRIMFNWLHWLCGMGSFVLATITIFLSVFLGKSLLRYTWKYQVEWVMGGYMALWFATTIAFEYVVKVYDVAHTNKIAAIKTEIPLSTITGPTEEKANKKIRSETIRVVILATFSVISLAFCIALSYMFVYTNH